jgi:hypothetical protein
MGKQDRAMPEAYADDVEPLASVRIDVEAFMEDQTMGEALPEGPSPEFRIHYCWRNIFLYPHPDFPNEPGEARCQGCGRTWRLEEEHRP